jgi:MFS family permease
LPTTVDHSIHAPLYDATFRWTYGAHFTMMIGVSLMFRYADFVTAVNGNEMQLGLIAGIGLIGSIFIRVLQALGIDRYGVRGIWLGSLILAICAVLAHTFVTRVDSPLIYLLSIGYRTGIAGAFGASIAYISNRVAESRMAEAVGTLGSAGFLAQMIGSLLVDQLIGGKGKKLPTDLHIMFYVVATALAASWFCGLMATSSSKIRRDDDEAPQPHEPISTLLKRHASFPLLVMGIIMGWGLGFPTVFVAKYAEALSITKTATFFTTYSASAFISRMLTRKFPQYYGERRMILLAMCSMVIGMLLFNIVSTGWLFVVPALFLGNAHAWLFPSIVTGGSRRFPAAARGLGTSLMLGVFDLGGLIGSTLSGTILARVGQFDLPAYPTLFATIATVFTLTTVWFLSCREPTSR